MITHTWKIHEIDATEGLITEVKYSVLARDIDQTVETEGYWRFGDPVLRKPLLEVKEEDVIAWVKADAMREGVNIIEPDVLYNAKLPLQETKFLDVEVHKSQLNSFYTKLLF